MYLALYRSERPEIFEEILGQEHIVKILKNQIKNGTVGQAYLFTGTRGTGKTSTARILAKALNCKSENRPCGICDNCIAIKEGKFLDVIELDAASNNGVEDIRRLRETVNYPPNLGEKKIYIIDEVHMLSTGAENALLKTLEEPPENVVFILATTDPQKVSATIRSRCVTMNFKRISENDLILGMKKVCEKRNKEITKDALSLLAINADGSVRDCLSLLEQCITASDEVIDRDLVLEYIGTVGDSFLINLTDAIIGGKIDEALVLIDSVIKDGKDTKQIIKDLLGHYRNLLIAKFVENAEDLINMSSENLNSIKEQSDRIKLAELNQEIILLSDVVNKSRYSTQPRILLETAVINMATLDLNSGAKDITKPKKKPVEEVHEKNTVVNSDKNDLDKLWANIVDVASKESSSFRTLVGRSCKLIEATEKELKLAIINPNRVGYVEKDRDLIKKAATLVLNKDINILVVKNGDKEAVNVNEAESIAEALKSNLNIDLAIK
ncbi:MAG TPA: DNA polymerase III subunit gamma/tau [Anaerovoracaceae bacterium]|nr:DNA polymerase III subunit gamma/tau [Anaerovoracaceae bacterium]